MKIKKAVFKNFRLLKDITLDFSTNPDKKLTVIRAANETGKTTSQTALLWGFFGREAFPKRAKYILAPKDQISDENIKISIEVWIEFEVDEKIQTGRGSFIQERNTYRLIRSATEIFKERQLIEREGENATMLQITENGTKKVDAETQKRVIHNALPLSLKDVYFTDGDSAMAFIEAAATQGIKRERVGNAIQSLLGINILERTITHLNSIYTSYSSEVGDQNYREQFESLQDKIDSYIEDIEELTQSLDQNKLNKTDVDSKLKSVELEIEDLLKKGDKESLVRNLKEMESQIARVSKELKSSTEQIGNLAGRNQHIATSLTRELAEAGYKLLDAMSKDNLLPKVNIPIIQDILTKRDACFCGSDVSEKTIEGKARRLALTQLIEDSREADAKQQAATSIYYAAGNLNFTDSYEQWETEYGTLVYSNSNQANLLSTLKSRQAILKQQADSIDDKQLSQKRVERDILKSDCTNLAARIAGDERSIVEKKEKLEDTRLLQRKLETKVSANETAVKKLKTTRLLQDVFKEVIQRMKEDEIGKVSGEMNRIFLSMIGSAPAMNGNTIINGCKLTRNYDICVLGPHGNNLDPDTDLNGASRRAITLAFILALTKVSSVEAPNVIDTPLGMMSGYVKQSVLLRCIEEGSQVILFLTHDEIREVEKIIDKHAGRIFTLTNPAHYPKMLVNKPPAQDARIIRCECNHRATCNLCARHSLEV